MNKASISLSKQPWDINKPTSSHNNPPASLWGYTASNQGTHKLVDPVAVVFCLYKCMRLWIIMAILPVFVKTLALLAGRSQAAISGISNPNSHAIQEHTLNFAHVVNHILSMFEDISISVEWTPADTRLRGFCQAKFHAQEECAQLSDDDIECRNILSATFQKQKTRVEAFEQWAHEWHNKPRTSLAYRLSLLNPPDDHNHPIWMAATKDEPSHSSFCTALRLAVGHSFTAEYTRRFKKDFEPLDVICECGSGERTLAHIIFDCELFSRARNEAQIDNRRTRPSLHDLFASLNGARQLLHFLQRATPAHKPTRTPWLPGVPRLDPTTDGWYWDDTIT
ncbi:hypothetical protein EI94DRAFT_1871338 [Lactarius quietus]|nr:hypothetical protein EI94DRAFT_1871338 [Lactarius quietus]